jgi:hypothetical protein
MPEGLVAAMSVTAAVRAALVEHLQVTLPVVEAVQPVTRATAVRVASQQHNRLPDRVAAVVVAVRAELTFLRVLPLRAEGLMFWAKALTVQPVLMLPLQAWVSEEAAPAVQMVQAI